MTILFIDDDRRLADVLGEYFAAEGGWEILHAYGPKEALEIVEHQPPELELVLLDIMMPPEGVFDAGRSDYGQSTGVLLLEKLRARLGESVPIVILSARQDLGWLLTEGKVEGYLLKTLTPDELVQGIREVLSPSNERSPSVSA